MGELSYRNIFFTEDEFEDFKKNHNGKVEYANGEILLSSILSCI